MTSSPGQEPPALGLHPEAAALLSEHIGPRLEQDSSAVAMAYSAAMAAGQLFEFAAKLAEPAASVDPHGIDCDELVAAGLRRLLFGAIEALGEVERKPPLDDLIEQLHERRKERNFLAHEFWLHAIPEMMAGRTSALLDRLSGAEAAFGQLTGELFTRIFEPALAARSVTAEDLQNMAATVAILQVFAPDVLIGLRLHADGDEVITRTATTLRIPPAVPE